MPDLDGEVAELDSAYVEELEATLAELEPWWQELGTKHGPKHRRELWPARLASHPRILEIYRRYDAKVRGLRAPLPSGPAPRFDDDAAWGSAAEADPETLLAPEPTKLLIDRLAVDAPSVHAAMIRLVVLPLAEAPEPWPSMRALQITGPDPQRTRGFEFEGRHGVRRGLTRLIGAGFDLRPHAMPNLGFTEASEVHRLAHTNYLRALEAALVEATLWWTGERLAAERRGLDPDQALDEVHAKHPVGPAAHPAVIGVLGAYWALCHEVNTAFVNVHQHVAPELMLLAWLVDGRHDTWIEILSALPYWPVTLDRAGAWR